jgi:hypothetical protein
MMTLLLQGLFPTQCMPPSLSPPKSRLLPLLLLISPIVRCEMSSPALQRVWPQTLLKHKSITTGKQIQTTSITIQPLPTSLHLLQPPHPEALPSLLTVPVTGTNTSSQLMQAMLAPSTLASCSSPITPSIPLTFAPPIMSHYVGTSKLPRPSDAASVNMGPHATQPSPYYTCSQASQITSLSIHSSSAVSISIALNPAQAPQPQSIQELLSENRRLKMTLDLVEKENTKLKANNDACHRC